MIAHPLQSVNPLVFGNSRKTMGDFWSNVTGTVWSAVSGLESAIKGALSATLATIGQIAQTLSLVVQAAIGKVKWSDALGSLGKVFQDIGSVMYYLNPARSLYTFLEQAPLTAHAFSELDKFTGGMLTNVVNISDLPFRAMRGDPISKMELLKDALTAIQVAAIVISGPIGLGAFVGTLIGRQVCSKQTEAKDACMAAFTIVGAATGSWASTETGLAWGAQSNTISQAEQNAWLDGDDAYDNFIQNNPFSDHLAAAAASALNNAGISYFQQAAIRMCQKDQWAGKQECKILGQVGGDYLRANPDEPFEDFLANEVVKIGMQQLMANFFPPKSRAHRAIVNHPGYHTGVPTGSAGTSTIFSLSNPFTLLVLAASTAYALFGAS